jgi:hypothetical protein
VRKGDKIRRCGSKLVGVIRELVPWKRFNLPLPQPAEGVNHEGEGEFFAQMLSHAQDTAAKVEEVICTARDAIRDLLLLPDDVPCVFLFVAKNAFGDELREALRSLWRDRMDNAEYLQTMLASRRRADAENCFAEYDAETRDGGHVWLARFHRSEEGRPIQTETSARCTRMVSARAAQGGGRRLALVFQLSEMGIQRVHTRGEQNLCYYSS